MSRHLLLTGRPGIGKTTLVERICGELSGVELAGFITRELRRDGERVGFALVPFGGPERPMAHRDFVSNERVGRYGVDVASIDYVVDTALSPKLTPQLWVVDEIGKMEMFSKRFVATMKRLLAGEIPLVATVALSGGLAERLGTKPGVELWTVTPDNRDALVGQAVAWVCERLPDEDDGGGPA